MKNANYCISTGVMTDDDGKIIAKNGFSGNNSREGVNPTGIKGYNNPAMVSVKFIGPLPPGTYKVDKPWGFHSPLGPNSVPLTQTSGESYGRGSFFVHGPGPDYNNSSEGCIVFPIGERLKVISFNPDQITVVA